MNLKEKNAKKGQGLIVAAIMENQNQANNQDPDRSSNNQGDVNETEQDHSPFTNPDPELEDPNFKPERDQDDDEDDDENDSNESARDDDHGRDRDDLIDPIDPLNSVSEQHDTDPDGEDQLELEKLDEDEIDDIEEDNLDRATPLDRPEGRDHDIDIAEDEDEYLEKWDFSPETKI